MNSLDVHRMRWWAFALLALPTILLAMDQSILNLALPQLSGSLGASGSQSLWIMDIYGFFLAGFLITMGSLGDRIGRRRLLLIGAAVFLVASVVAAYAPTPEALILARAAMGMAGATLMPSTLALLSNIFESPKERSAAIAAWFSCMMVGGAIGPIVGGALLGWFWWGSVFLIGVPVMVLLLVAGPLMLPEFRDDQSGRLDLFSVPLSLGAILPVVYALKEFVAGANGTGPWAALFIGGLVGLAFLRRQQVLTDPMVDLRLFRSRRLSASLVILFFGSMTTGGMYLLVSLYLQTVEEFSPIVAGLWLLPSTLAIVVGSMIAPALLGKVEANVLVAGGLLVTAFGYALMAFMPEEGGLALLIVAFVLAFLGIGPMGAIGTDLVVNEAPKERAGSAASLSESSNHMGISVGIAAFGSIASIAYRGRMEDVAVPTEHEGIRESVIQAAALSRDIPGSVLQTFSTDLNAAFVSGLHATAWVGVVLFLGLAVVAGTMLKGARAHLSEEGDEPDPGNASGSPEPEGDVNAGSEALPSDSSTSRS